MLMKGNPSRVKERLQLLFCCRSFRMQALKMSSFHLQHTGKRILSFKRGE